LLSAGRAATIADMAIDYDAEINVYKELKDKQARGVNVTCDMMNLGDALVNKGLAKTITASLRRLDKIIAEG
jgi:hypothetical protein